MFNNSVSVYSKAAGDQALVLESPAQSKDALHLARESQLSSVQFSRSVVSNTLCHELRHTRPSCPSPTPGVYPNLCPSSW